MTAQTIPGFRPALNKIIPSLMTAALAVLPMQLHAEDSTEDTPIGAVSQAASDERESRKTAFQELKDLDRKTQIVLSESLVLQRDLLILAERFALPEAVADPSSVITYLDTAARFLAAKGNQRLALPVRDNRRLADLYLAYGMHREASSLYDYLQQTGEPAPPEAWLALANHQYRRGYHGLTGAVDYSLSHISRRSPRQISGEKALLLGQTYIEQRRYNDAEKLLDNLRGTSEQRRYAEYNRGIAMLRGPDPEEGASLLDRVGKMSPKTPAMSALRDRANLNLGLHFLEQEQGGTAIPILLRVRLNGPYSNHALLALGWARLAEEGSYQANPGDLPPECDLGPVGSVGSLIGIMRARSSGCEITPRFRRVKDAGDDEDDLFRTALVPWLELVERDPGDPAVQEALLAVPFALENLGEYAAAGEAYRKAVQRLDVEKRATIKTLAAINDGRMLTNMLRQPIQAAGDTGPEIKPAEGIDLQRIYPVLANHPFRESLQSLRDLKALSRVFEDWDRRIAYLDRKVDIAVNSYQSGQRGDKAGSLRYSQIEQPRIRYLSSGRSNRDGPALKLDLNLSDFGNDANEDDSIESAALIADTTAGGGLGDAVSNQKETLLITKGHINSTAYAHEQFLTKLLADHVNRRKQRTIIYLARAQLAQARIAERLAADAAPEPLDFDSEAEPEE